MIVGASLFPTNGSPKYRFVHCWTVGLVLFKMWVRWGTVRIWKKNNDITLPDDFVFLFIIFFFNFYHTEGRQCSDSPFSVFSPLNFFEDFIYSFFIHFRTILFFFHSFSFFFNVFLIFSLPSLNFLLWIRWIRCIPPLWRLCSSFLLFLFFILVLLNTGFPQ